MAIAPTVHPFHIRMNMTMPLGYLTPVAAGARPQVARPATEGSVLPALVMAHHVVRDFLSIAPLSADSSIEPDGRAKKTPCLDHQSVLDVLS